MISLKSMLRNQFDKNQFIRSLISPFIMLLPYFYLPESISLQIIIFIVIGFMIIDLNFVLHNHIHTPFTKFKKLNRYIDFSLSFCTGLTAGNWRLIHTHGHHVIHLKDTLTYRKDYFSFQKHSNIYTRKEALAYSFRASWFQFWLPIRDGWSKGIMGKGFKKRYYSYIFYEILGVYSIVVCLFYINPFITFGVFIVPYFLVYLFSTYIDYLTHTNIKKNGEFSHSRVCTDPSYNKRCWNFGYHIIHHLYPKLHWSKLKEKFEESKLEKLDDCIEIESLNLISGFSPFKVTWSTYDRNVT